MKHNNIARDNKTKHKRWNTDSSDDSNGEELDYRTKWFEKVNTLVVLYSIFYYINIF